MIVRETMNFLNVSLAQLRSLTVWENSGGCSKSDFLHLKNGYPSIYFEFLSNVVATGLTNNILPIPQTSTNGYLWLKENSVQAPLIYIDADHEAVNVYSEISNDWEVVSPGGALFGDDFVFIWLGVSGAVKLFAEKKELPLQMFGEKWLLRKDAE